MVLMLIGVVISAPYFHSLFRRQSLYVQLSYVRIDWSSKLALHRMPIGTCDLFHVADPGSMSRLIFPGLQRLQRELISDKSFAFMYSIYVQ